jgi:amino acid transporter
MPDPIAVVEAVEAQQEYGLRRGILSPLEVLAQSVSVIAPSSTPPLTVGLVFALAGEGSWLAYVLATAAMVLMALCIAEFARDSASPGSLYVYTRQTLPPVFAAVEAWALFFAYVVTSAATTAGFAFFALPFLKVVGLHVPVVLLAAICLGGAAWVAYRDVKISTQAMLWIEVVSVLLIVVVIGILLWEHGPHVDGPQLRLEGVTVTKVARGMMLALFSFVGFESATALGSEAKNPLKTIPQAVVRSAILAGIFFIVCTYGEVLGFRGVTPGIADHAEPMRFLAERAGVGFVGWIINFGVLVSLFACSLGCVIAAARVLLLMAHHGLAHKRLAMTDKAQETPSAAGVLVALLSFVPVALLSIRGSLAEDIFAWLGTLAMYGFMTAYGLVAVALPFHLRKVGCFSSWGVVLGVLGTGAAVAAIGGTIYPVPEAPYVWLPYVYLAFMASGVSWWWVAARRGSLGGDERT